jgi:hypothetical protein
MKTVIIKTIYGVGITYWLDGKEIAKELAESFIVAQADTQTAKYLEDLRNKYNETK